MVNVKQDLTRYTWTEEMRVTLIDELEEYLSIWENNSKHHRKESITLANWREIADAINRRYGAEFSGKAGNARHGDRIRTR